MARFVTFGAEAGIWVGTCSLLCVSDRFDYTSMLIAVIILVLISALVATDPDTPGGGQQKD
jgi:hypothetical protein